MRLKNLNIKEKESDVQAAIVMRLRFAKYTVLQTNAAIRKVAADPGVPDLIVTSDRWPSSIWVGLEVKTSSGKPSHEQQELLDRNRITIVRSMDDAMTAIKKAEEALNANS